MMAWSRSVNSVSSTASTLVDAATRSKHPRTGPRCARDTVEAMWSGDQGPSRSARQVARQVDRRVAMVGAVLLFLVLVLSACVVPPPDGAANGKWVLLFTRAQG